MASLFGDPSSLSKAFATGASAGSDIARRNLYNLQLQDEMQKRDEVEAQKQRIAQLVPVYQTMKENGANDADFASSLAAQGQGNEAQQFLAQKNAPLKQALSTAAIMAVTAPTDDEFHNTKLSLYRNAVKQGADLSSLGIQSEEDAKNLTRADMASWILDQKVLEEIGKQRASLIAKHGSDSGYHPPIQTTEGYSAYNAKTGKWETIRGESGRALMPPVASAELAGQKTTAQKTAAGQVAKELAFPKVREQYASLNRQWDLVDEHLNKAISEVSPFTAGMGAWASAIPATPQKNLKETLETIKANIGFDKLADMRQNSPTGAALGAISDFENKLLQAVQGSLDQKQSAGRLKENLQRVKKLLADVRAQKAKAYQLDYGQIAGQVEDNNQGVQSVGRFKVRVKGAQ